MLNMFLFLFGHIAMVCEEVCERKSAMSFFIEFNPCPEGHELFTQSTLFEEATKDCRDS